MKKLLLIFHTIRHLRPIQIRYQLWYRLRRMWRKVTGFNYPLSVKKQGTPVKLQPWIDKPISYDDGTYTFLNQQESNPPLGGNIRGAGALWSYNLNYMDYLLQPGLDQQTGLQLIENFIQHLPQNPTGPEPYPIALRGINWIKFLSKHENSTLRSPRESAAFAARTDTKKTLRSSREIVAPAARNKIDYSLYAQYMVLLDNPEYHLLANHLLEDGFSLLFGAFYFNDSVFYNKAKQIIETELNEQILEDGAHFELSPMYHQIILDRLLDGINLLQNNQCFETQHALLKIMKRKAQKMLTWLNTITFSTGEIPLLNDSAPGIAPTTQQLNKYAASLNLQPATCNLQLGDSGYRNFTTPSYECIIDIGQIGPSYQPGHAHADTFNFVLNVKKVPVIVDTGISTYDAGETRLKERGTAAHNTVTVQDKNSSEVWSSFRVARRAKVNVLKDDKNNVVAQHDGYKRMGATHQREWNFEENQIEITDTLTGKIKKGKAHFWFSPRVNPKKSQQTIEIKNTRITFENAVSINVVKTETPKGYNLFSKTTKVEISFSGILKTTIRTKQHNENSILNR